MQHPDEGTVHAWLDDALPAEEAQALETHVASCAECAALVAEARGLIASASRIVRQLDGVPAKVVPIAAAQRTPVTRSWARYSGLAAAMLFVASTATWVAVRDKGAIGVTVPSVAMELDAAKAAPMAADSMVATPSPAPSAIADAAPVAQSLTSTPARESVGRAAQSLADRRSEAVAVPMAAAPSATAPATTASAMPAPAIAARMSAETANDAPLSLAGCYRLSPIAATGNSVATTLRLTDSLTPSDAATRSTATPIDRLAGTYLGYATGLGPVLAPAERVQASAKANDAPLGAATRAAAAAPPTAARTATTRSAMASAAAPAAAPAFVLNTNAMIRWSPAGDGLVRVLLADQSTILIRLTADATALSADISRDRDATRTASAPAVQFTATRVSCPQ